MSSHSPVPQEEIKFKRPDFTILDDKQEDSEDQFPHQEAPQQPVQGISFRFFCFLGLLFCAIFGTGILIASFFLTLMALIFFLQNRELNQSVLSLWKLCVNTIIAAFGFAVGLISPTLGLLIVYFAMAGKSLLSRLFNGVFNRH